MKKIICSWINTPYFLCYDSRHNKDITSLRILWSRDLKMYRTLWKLMEAIVILYHSYGKGCESVKNVTGDEQLREYRNRCANCFIVLLVFWCAKIKWDKISTSLFLCPDELIIKTVITANIFNCILVFTYSFILTPYIIQNLQSLVE